MRAAAVLKSQGRRKLVHVLAPWETLHATFLDHYLPPLPLKSLGWDGPMAPGALLLRDASAGGAGFGSWLVQ